MNSYAKQTMSWKEFKKRFGEDTTTNIQLIQIAKMLKIPITKRFTQHPH